MNPEDIKLIERHVTNTDKSIYVIHNLPPEVVAVLFAYVSRSPNSFRDNLLTLIKQKDIEINGVGEAVDYSQAKEKARSFHERWVVGYGHSSVAEHAIASVAIEDVSIIASKIIEDNRLASYTEKSTRYQIFDKSRYIRPRKIMESKHADLYIRTMDLLFDTYSEFIEVLLKHMRELYPRLEGQPEKVYENIIKARACDVARYVLPAGTLTNLAMTGNARVMEHAITKLMSDQLEEAQEIGRQVKEEVKKIIPTLVKYADRNSYMAETCALIEEDCKGMDLADNGKSVQLVDYDRDAYDKLAASITYRCCKGPYQEALRHVKSLSLTEKEKIIDDYLKRMGRHDYPMRELEHIYYTFDILVDYGAYRDIQRHRMCTQTTQDLTTKHGYSIPPELKDLELEEKYIDCMEKAAAAFKAIWADLPKEAQYVLPLAYRKRTLFTWNLRELFHFIKLRSGREGHISYRKIAWEIFDEIEIVHPLLAKYLKVDKSQGASR